MSWFGYSALAPTATSSLPASFQDSVFGVVELQSVPGVGELRCAGDFEPNRREQFLKGAGGVDLGRRASA
jgi:hypothetical protein